MLALEVFQAVAQIERLKGFRTEPQQAFALIPLSAQLHSERPNVFARAAEKSGVDSLTSNPLFQASFSERSRRFQSFSDFS